ncbi:hypothetical protein E2C01_045426 [Portunus trituberculatus]|uniref:Uncharacterized protein n=1 Tax=Portunus trituberculatus TaxID=210409 RepID=A0A5B7G200_PORTR|nr:hypothetical protein [Portunus trituberculatus]
MRRVQPPFMTLLPQ